MPIHVLFLAAFILYKISAISVKTGYVISYLRKSSVNRSYFVKISPELIEDPRFWIFFIYVLARWPNFLENGYHFGVDNLLILYSLCGKMRFIKVINSDKVFRLDLPNYEEIFAGTDFVHMVILLMNTHYAAGTVSDA